MRMELSKTTNQILWVSLTNQSHCRKKNDKKAIVWQVVKIKWMNLIVRFQNGFKIELRVLQLWSEIILVISNRTRAVRSFDFEITRVISDQIALHSDQLPL